MRPVLVSTLLVCFLALLARLVPAQAPVWSLADNLESPGQWTIYGRDANAGTSGLPTTSGDFNGDGLDDLAMNGVLTDTWVVLSDGLGGDEVDLVQIDINAPPPRVTRVVRDAATAGFAGEISAGDFNDDGYDDLMIGSQTSDGSRGWVYIVWGNANFGGQVIPLAGTPPPGFTVTSIRGVTEGHRVGLWVATADVDLDGIDDLLFTADQSTGGFVSAEFHSGSAFVVYGTRGAGPGTLFGMAGTHNAFPIDALPSGSGLTTMHGVDAEDHFGATMHGGDLDGDGRPELVVSAALDRAGAQFGGHAAAGADGIGNSRSNAGETYIFWDDDIPSRDVTLDLRIDPPPNVTRIIGPRAGEFTGEELWSGDFDGDGLPDLMLGAIVANGSRGGVWIIYNDGQLMGKTIDLIDVNSASGEVVVDGDTIRTSEIRGANTNDILGDTFRVLDMNRDGIADIGIGVPSHLFSYIYVFFGSPVRFPPLFNARLDPTLSDPALAPFYPLRVSQIGTGDTIAYSMHLGDYNGDGYMDLVSNGMRAEAKVPGGPSRPGQAYHLSGRALALAAGAPLGMDDPIELRVLDPGDVIVGNSERSASATAGATGVNPFVYPDAIDLAGLVFDEPVPFDQLKWSFTGGGGRILINGVGPLDESLSGIGADDPTSPREANRLDLNNGDIEDADGLARTLTFRNAELSPSGGPNLDPMIDGIITSQTTTITLFASDCTTFASRAIVVYTANNTSDAISGGSEAIDSIDFRVEGDQGGAWLSGILSGSGTPSVGANGLCLSVPGPGENDLAWVSPERFIDLVDNTVFRVRLTVSSTTGAPDAIPLWFIDYDNFNSSGLGNNYGGMFWFLDVDGGANGAGRANGPTRFEAYLAPNSVATPQWRGLIDSANSAFTPQADPINDMRLVFRVIDLEANQPILSVNDFGTLCLEALTVEAISLDALQVARTVYDAPISSATHFAQTLAQEGTGGAAVINDLANEAGYALAAPEDRKTFGPFDAAEPTLNRQLYPVVWRGDTLYRARMRIRAPEEVAETNRGGGPPSQNPVDVIFVSMDTATSELGALHFTTRGSAGNMQFAASPRPASRTGGAGQDYLGFMYGHNATSGVTPDGGRLRALGDFFNTTNLFGPATGTDAFTVEALEIDSVIAPD